MGPGMQRTNRHVATSALATTVWLTGCADPCVDDGLIQENNGACPAATGIDSEDDSTGGSGDTVGDGTMGTGTGADSGDGSGDASGSGTNTGETESGTDTSGPSCDNETLDGDETDVDCGGSCPVACADGESCEDDSDCSSQVCGEDGTCQSRSCTDGTQNGDETDVDCGGSCEPCPSGRGCVDGEDCRSGVCDDGTCEEPLCDDGVQNGDETDVDCGGMTCDPCGDGAMCMDASDCQSMVCDPVDMTCTPPACDDGLQNGDETDEDCGGACGATCEPGETCGDGDDCLSAGCDGGSLTCNDYLSVSAAPACSESDGTPVSLSAVASGGTGGPYTYAWTPDDGTVANPDMANTDVDPVGFASYTVTVNDGVNMASDTVVVVNNAPFDLDGNCTLYNADYAGSGNPAAITYDMGGTRACELGNNEFGLHLCEGVSFSDTGLVGTVEVLAGSGDDDWVGLVWGAQDASNLYSLVWKGASQDVSAFGCMAPGGVLVKRIEAAAFSDLSGADWYCPQDTASSTTLVLPTDVGSTTAGWQEGQSYTVEIDYTATGSMVTITRDSDLAQIASFPVADMTFSSGVFGSTTMSQANACVGPLFGGCL